MHIHPYVLSGSHSRVLPQGVEYKAVGRVEGGDSKDLALRLIPGEKTVVSLPGIMGGHGQGKPGEGVCKVHPVDNLVTTLGCDMVALQEFDIPEREDHSTLPFHWG